MEKQTQSWTGKKSPTNPVRKEQHTNRRTKKLILNQQLEVDWKDQLKDYNAHK